MSTTKRQELGPHSLNSDAWERFWSQFLEQFSQWAPNSATSQESRSIASTDRMGSVIVTVPYSTTTVGTTIWCTTFVTIHVPNASPNGGAVAETMSSSTVSSDSGTTLSATSSVSLRSGLASSDPSSRTTSSSEQILPPVVVPTSSSTSSPLPTSDEAASGTGLHRAQSEAQKHAIIGGLSGSMAGLVLVGLLVCLILRMRRKKHAGQQLPLAEKEEHRRPPLDRAWTDLPSSVMPIGRSAKDSPQQPHQKPMAPVTVDEDHRIIRMNTRHWPRPFAAGEGEGYRDSAPLGRLRVVNPDLSRPSTPRRSSDTNISFLQKQKQAFSGFMFASPKSQSNTRIGGPQHPLAQEVPSVAIIDPALSQEWLTSQPYTPSFRSYPSLASLPSTRQQSPVDPFITPTSETEKRLPDLPPAVQRSARSVRGSRRPSMASRQDSASSSKKPFSQFGGLLHPYQARTVTKDGYPASSDSSPTVSRRSDPFDLDRPSIRDSTYSQEQAASEFRRRSPSPRPLMYEGT